MAKYTELFSEYLESGGLLPELFEDIDGFTDLFKARYCDNEIGAETETLFAIKLEAKARLHIPVYKQRIDELAALHLGVSGTPTKTHYEHTVVTGSDSRTGSLTSNTSDGGTQNIGAQKVKVTELPNSSSALPNNVTDTDASVNSDSRTGSRTDTSSDTGSNSSDVQHTVEDTGYSVTEAYQMISELNGKVFNVIEALLNEFRSCFMQIY